MKVSIAIPCYEMAGRGAECLAYSLEKIALQSYANIEVVVSDHSVDCEVENTCADFHSKLNLIYIRNPKKRGQSSANHNSCIKYSSGEIIKFLCQDDYLFDDRAIEKIVPYFQSGANWLVSSYIHTKDRVNFERRQDPSFNKNIHFDNSIGTHSCLAVRNEALPYFDENLIWFMDCEYYRQLYNLWGLPVFLYDLTVVQFLWGGQVSNTLAAGEKLGKKELEYVLSKHS